MMCQVSTSGHEFMRMQGQRSQIKGHQDINMHTKSNPQWEESGVKVH